jgi:hypothetical protein
MSMLKLFMLTVLSMCNLASAEAVGVNSDVTRHITLTQMRSTIQIETYVQYKAQDSAQSYYYVVPKEYEDTLVGIQAHSTSMQSNDDLHFK